MAMAPTIDRGELARSHRSGRSSAVKTCHGEPGGMVSPSTASVSQPSLSYGVSLVLQSGFDQSLRGPGGHVHLINGREPAQVLQDDHGLPSDDHGQGGDEALEPSLVEP